MQTVALMEASIQKYKFCEHVGAEHLNCLTQARNENKALREAARVEIHTLKGKLKCAEDSHASMAEKAMEQETCLEEMATRVREAERDGC